ncbi:MAG: hypothetical protein NW218_11525 [Saprospiraceae bacterium]|nr:hypothetical protein [Saprospiraceae bacterium]
MLKIKCFCAFALVLTIGYAKAQSTYSLAMQDTSWCGSVFMQSIKSKGDLEYKKAVDSLVDKYLSKKFFEIPELSLKSLIPKVETEIDVSTMYANGASASYFGSGWFTDIQITQRSTVLEIPILLTGELVVQQNKVNRRLSGISVSFDAETYFNKWKSKIEQQSFQQHLKSLPIDQKEKMLSQAQVENWRSKMLEPEYQQQKAALLKQIDSLQNTTLERTDSLALEKLKDTRSHLNQWEIKVDSMYQKGMTEVNSLQGNFDVWKRNYSNFQETLSQGKNATIPIPDKYNNGRFTSHYPWLLNLRNLKFGNFRMNGSILDVNSVPLRGGCAQYMVGKYFFAFGIGKEGQTQRNLPDYVQHYKFNASGRHIMQVKVGVGAPDASHAHLSLTTIKVPESSSDSNVTTFARKNVLLNLDGRYNLNKAFYVTMLAGLANSDFSGKSEFNNLLNELYDKQNKMDNFAGIANIHWRAFQGKTELAFGFQHIGFDYISLGNPYLLVNRNSLKLEWIQHLLKHRAKLKFNILASQDAGTKSMNANFRQRQLSGEFSFRLDKRGSRLTASYTPAYFRQFTNSEIGVVYQINLINISLQILYPRTTRGQWVSTFHCANYQNQIQFQDSSAISGLWYLLGGQYFQSKHYTFTASCNAGMDPAKQFRLRDFNADVSQGFQLNKLNLQQGFQVIKRYYEQGYLTGFSIGIQTKFKGALTLGVRGNYLWALSNTQKNQFYFQSALGWKF